MLYYRQESQRLECDNRCLRAEISVIVVAFGCGGSDGCRRRDGSDSGCGGVDVVVKWLSLF